MLFKDILDKKTKTLQPEFDKLFEDAFHSQSHKGDLILVRENGFYNPEVHNWNNTSEKMSPYMIGPNKEGHSFYLHYEFIDNYRKQPAILRKSFEDYLKELKYTPEKRKEIDLLEEFEGMSIQLEMLLYLKIWEADSFIKKFYQIIRLIHGEHYDWHFKIKESNRDKDAIATRDKLIREHIRNRIKDKYPNIYKAFENGFKTQIRNSIAHSKYNFQGRHIHWNNFIEKDKHAQIKVSKFDDWIDIFHDTMVIFNQYILFLERISIAYSKFAQQNNLILEVRITRKDPEDKVEYADVKYRLEYGDWFWASNDI